MNITLASDILVSRFDNYFPRSEKNMDLRKYIKKFYTLAFGGQRGGYVPRIFVMYFRKSGHYLTSATVTLNNPTIIPPVDVIHFVKRADFFRRQYSILGFLKMKDFSALFSPYLETIDKYPYLKLLSFNHDSVQTIIHKLKTSPLLQPADDGDLANVDMIPNL